MSGYEQNIQWFPGHMTKTLRAIEAEIKNVDVVVELLDSRIPKSSKNPELERLSKQKPKLLLLNKSDLADAAATAEWTAYYKAQGYGALAIDSKEKRTEKLVSAAIHETLSTKLENIGARGMGGLKLRAMVVGIPNVGKSTFINNMAKSAATRVADRPGVTRGKQWISTENLDLLDMPGVLWPKFESMKTANNLAFTGAISDNVVDMTALAASLLFEIKDMYKERLEERYKINYQPTIDDYELLEMIAKRRGMLLSKGEYDIDRAAIMLLDELRGKKLGRITLERP